jgi:hypothetical protein
MPKMLRLATSTETGGRWPVGPSPQLKFFSHIFLGFFVSTFAECPTKNTRQRHLCRRFFTEWALLSVTLGKAFTEGI